MSVLFVRRERRGRHREAGELIESFSGTLAPERAERFLRVPAIVEIRALAG